MSQNDNNNFCDSEAERAVLEEQRRIEAEALAEARREAEALQGD